MGHSTGRVSFGEKTPAKAPSEKPSAFDKENRPKLICAAALLLGFQDGNEKRFPDAAAEQSRYNAEGKRLESLVKARKDGDGKRLWDPMLSMNAEIPLKNIRVLFTGEPVDVDGKKGRAEAVYWESPAGAKVFASGAIRWDWGFGRPGYSTPAFLTFSRNLFDYFRK